MIFTFILGEPAHFEIHDLSAFPIVRFDTSSVTSGYAPRWCREMEALLGLGEPFVLVASGQPNESHEDRKTRTVFLKTHRRQLARWCRAVIGVEPSPIARTLRNGQGAVMARAFGIEMFFVASLAEADLAARELLSNVQAAE